MVVLRRLRQSEVVAVVFEQGLCKQRYVPGQGCRPEGQLQVQSLCVRRALSRWIQERVGALQAVVSSEGGRAGAQGQEEKRRMRCMQQP